MPITSGTHTERLFLSAETVKAEAKRLGFYACGIAPVQPVDSTHTAFFKQWLQEKRQGEMAYMENYSDKRTDPSLLVEDAHTVISVALNYYPNEKMPADAPQLAWYAYGQDYHDLMRHKLQSLLTGLQENFSPGTLTGRCFCDTAPILERYWAWRCGLGWIGKHTQLIIPHAGSTFFLGELILNLPADRYDSPLSSHCGTCHRCIDACPVTALSEHKGLDARRCLSYLTIENRREIPDDAAARMAPYFYGCDRCQLACPHLRHAVPTQEEELHPKKELLAMTAKDWQNLTIDEYRTLFKGSAVKRAKYEGLMRNIKAMNKELKKEKK